MNEHEHQSAFFHYLTLHVRRDPRLAGIFAVPNAAKRSPKTAALMIAEGLKKGVSDIVIPIPSRDYHGAFFEMKMKGKKPTPEQAEFLKLMQFLGYYTDVPNTWIDAVNELAWYLDDDELVVD